MRSHMPTRLVRPHAWGRGRLDGGGSAGVEVSMGYGLWGGSPSEGLRAARVASATTAVPYGKVHLPSEPTPPSPSNFQAPHVSYRHC